MFLKNHKFWVWFCGILAAFLFSIRLVLIETNVFSNFIAKDNMVETTTFATIKDDVVETTIFATIKDDVETTTFAVILETNERENEEQSVEIQEVDTDKEEESKEESEEQSTVVYRSEKENSRRMTLSSLLLAAGIVLAVVFIFLMKEESHYLGPEAELFLLSFCVIWIRQLITRDAFYFVQIRQFLTTKHTSVFYLAYLWILFFLLLFSIRCLWTWIRKGFPFEWRIGHRLGKRVVGSSGKQSRYLLLQFGISMGMLMGCTFFLFWLESSFSGWMLGLDCLIVGMLSVSNLIRLTYDMDHLSEQIRYLNQDNEIRVRTGVFAKEEEALMDFYRQRDEAIDTAVISERFKVELISNVSHDLRTPLTAILGYGELLKAENLSFDGRKQLEELNRKTGYMRDLVDSLFELTKVSSGAEKSKKEQIDLIRLLEQTIGLFDNELQTNHLLVRRHYDTESLLIVTDGTRMHQVFANLIGNAIKYSLENTRIHLEVKEMEKEVLIRMTNISSYEMNFDVTEILQRFVRGDQARTTKGSGLGLAIAQTYTESVGGVFEVEIDAEQFHAIVKLPKTE